MNSRELAENYMRIWLESYDLVKAPWNTEIEALFEKVMGQLFVHRKFFRDMQFELKELQDVITPVKTDNGSPATKIIARVVVKEFWDKYGDTPEYEQAVKETAMGRLTRIYDELELQK